MMGQDAYEHAFVFLGGGCVCVCVCVVCKIQIANKSEAETEKGELGKLGNREGESKVALG